MSSVEKTKYGTYRARWIDERGAPRAKSFKLAADARKHLLRVEGDDFVDPRHAKTTVRKMADEWITGAMNLRTGTRETYQRDLDRYILPALGDLKLASLKPAVIDKVFADELERGVAPSSVHRHYRTLHRMLEVAVVKGRLSRNPCAAVTPPRVPKTEMRFLDVAQVEALATAIKPRYHAWVLAAAYLGFRWSEGRGLRRCDVTADRVTIAGQLLHRFDGTWEREDAKSAAGRRSIQAPAFVAHTLAEHLDVYVEKDPGALVFTSAMGLPLRSSTFHPTVFKLALARAGLDTAVRVHDLRHTAVALAIAAGAHPKAIQARLGHASISITLDRYGHLFPGADATVATGLDDLRAAAKPKLRVV